MPSLRRLLSMKGLVLALLVASSLRIGAQIPEFAFYREFRNWQRSLPAAERASLEQVLDRYRRKLTTEGIGSTEIERRITLIRTRREDLENDFWNRFFTEGTANFNRAPNDFLVSVAETRKPGRALDVGMGEGRNALYLAKLGWDVTGFDPADKAVGLAEQRARALGLNIHTAVAKDTQFDFGRGQWDLILYSWVGPVGSAAKAIDGLRPGGIVVVEIARGWYPQNGLLEMFKPLLIRHYTDERLPSDYFNREELNVVRLVAEKPMP